MEPGQRRCILAVGQGASASRCRWPAGGWDDPPEAQLGTPEFRKPQVRDALIGILGAGDIVLVT